MLLGHIIYKYGLIVNPTKITVIVDLVAPTTIKQLHATLGHMGCYHMFMHIYAQITMPLEKLLKKFTKFVWKKECQRYFNEIKQILVTAPILVFLDWTKEFHMHVDVLSIVLGAILAQPGDGEIDHPIVFVSRKLITTERNYTIEREGLTMVYCV